MCSKLLIIFKSKYYKILVWAIVLTPNLFVICLGIESFPLTCAPMFTHHIDNDTDLYLLKFEGITSTNKKVDLKDFYGRMERDFMRHFFGKVYGIAKGRNPLNSLLFEDTEESFEKRMNVFFGNYNAYLLQRHQLSFKSINLLIIKVDKQRTPLSEYQLLGNYNVATKSYTYGE